VGSARRPKLILLVLAAMYLCGCSAVADSPNSISAVLANARHRHLKFADARGPLTNAQGKAIVVRLEQASGKTDILKRHLAFEQAITGSPLIVGNKVTLLENGADTYRAMLAGRQATVRPPPASRERRLVQEYSLSRECHEKMN
jgi:cardiolipin synthase A/B